MAGSPGNGRPTGPAMRRSYNQHNSYYERERSSDRRGSGLRRESSERRGTGRRDSPNRIRSPLRGPFSYDGGKEGPNENYVSRGHGRRVSRDESSRSMSPKEDRGPGRNLPKDSPIQLQPPLASLQTNTSRPTFLDPKPTSKSAESVSKASETTTKSSYSEQKSVDLLGVSLADIFKQLVSESVDAALLQSKQLTAGTLQASAKADQKQFRKNGGQFPTSNESYNLNTETAARAYTSISEKAKKKEELVNAASASAAAKVIPMFLEATQSTSAQLSCDKLKLDVDALEKRCQGFQSQYEEQKKILDEIKSRNEPLDFIVKAQKAVIDKQTMSLESLVNRVSELENKGDVATQLQSLSSKYSGLESQSRETATSLYGIKQWQQKATVDMNKALKSKADIEKCLQDIGQDIVNLNSKTSAPRPAAALPLPADVLEKLDMVQNLSEGITRRDKFHDDLQKRVVILEGKTTTLSNNCLQIANDQIDYRMKFPLINARIDAVETRATTWEQSSQAAQAATSSAVEKLRSSHDHNVKTLEQRINQKEAEVSPGISKVEQRLSLIENTAKLFAESQMQQLIQQIASEKHSSTSGVKQHQSVHKQTGEVKDTSETSQAITALARRLDKLEAGNVAVNTHDVHDIRERLQKLEGGASSIAQILTRLDKVEDACDVAGEATDAYVGELINSTNDKLEKTSKGLEDRIGSLEDGVSQIRESASKNQTSQAHISDAQARIGALERTSRFPQANEPSMQDTTSASTADLQALDSRITQMITHFGGHFARLDDPRFSSLTQQSEANAAAFDSLEARYCNISTGDVYQAMASQFSANELPQFNQLQHSVSNLLSRVTHVENGRSDQSTNEKVRGMEEQAGLLNGRIEMLEIQLPEMATAETLTAMKIQVDEMDKMIKQKAVELERRIQNDQEVAETTRTDLDNLRTEFEVNKRSAATKMVEFMLDVNDNVESIQEHRPIRAPTPAPIHGAKRKNMGSVSNGNSTHSPSPSVVNGYPKKSPVHSPRPSAPRKKTKISRKSYLDDDEPADFDEIQVRAPSDEED